MTATSATRTSPNTGFRRLLRRERGAGRWHQPGPSGAAPALHLPQGADWGWRPALWSGLAGLPVGRPVLPGDTLCDGVRLFHDGQDSAVAAWVAPAPVAGQSAVAPGLALDLTGFDGGFLSLAVALPPAALAGLGRHHIIGLAVRLAADIATPVYGRLSVRHGPNTDTLLRAAPVEDRAAAADFDLWVTDVDVLRIAHAWVDLIFEAPRVRRLTLSDLTLHRRPRAPL